MTRKEAIQAHEKAKEIWLQRGRELAETRDRLNEATRNMEEAAAKMLEILQREVA
jgi:hypothetical protein